MKPVITLYDNGVWAYVDDTPVQPTPPGGVPPITTLPPISLTLGVAATNNPGVSNVAPNQVVAAMFTVSDDPSKTLSSFGQPGNFSRASWTIFSMGGARLYWGDNQPVFNGLIIDPATVLTKLIPGDYVFAVAQDLSLPKLAFYWNQQ